MKAESKNKTVATRVSIDEHERIMALAKRYFDGGISELIKAAVLSYIPPTSYCYGTKIDPLKVTLVDQLVEIGKKTIDPIQVIVFGSQARGDFTPDSDLDIIFIVSDKETIQNTRLAAKIGVEELRQKIKDPVDVLVRKKSQVYGEEYKDKELIRNIRKEGVSIYERL